MTAIQIILLILLICILVGQIPLSIGGQYSATQQRGWVKIGFIQITLFPKKEKSAPKNEKKSKKKKEKKDDKSPMTVPQMIALGLDLLPVIKGGVLRFFGSIRMEQFRANLILAGVDDPAESAIRYGQGSALLSALWPPLVDVFNIQDGSAHLDVDFTTSEMKLEGSGILSIRLGQLISILVALATRGLIIFLRHRRQNKLREAVS